MAERQLSEFTADIVESSNSTRSLQQKTIECESAGSESSSDEGRPQQPPRPITPTRKHSMETIGEIGRNPSPLQIKRIRGDNSCPSVASGSQPSTPQSPASTFTLTPSSSIHSTGKQHAK